MDNYPPCVHTNTSKAGQVSMKCNTCSYYHCRLLLFYTICIVYIGVCHLNPATLFLHPLEYKIYIKFGVTGKVQAQALIWHRNYVSVIFLSKVTWGWPDLPPAGFRRHAPIRWCLTTLRTMLHYCPIKVQNPFAICIQWQKSWEKERFFQFFSKWEHFCKNRRIICPFWRKIFTFWKIKSFFLPNFPIIFLSVKSANV